MFTKYQPYSECCAENSELMAKIEKYVNNYCKQVASVMIWIITGCYGPLTNPVRWGLVSHNFVHSLIHSTNTVAYLTLSVLCLEAEVKWLTTQTWSLHSQNVQPSVIKMSKRIIKLMHYEGQNAGLWKHIDQSWPTIWGHRGGLQWVTKAYVG